MNLILTLSDGKSECCFHAVAMVIQSGLTKDAMILKFCLTADNYFNVMVNYKIKIKISLTT